MPPGGRGRATECSGSQAAVGERERRRCRREVAKSKAVPQRGGVGGVEVGDEATSEADLAKGERLAPADAASRRRSSLRKASVARRGLVDRLRQQLLGEPQVRGEGRGVSLERRVAARSLTPGSGPAELSEERHVGAVAVGVACERLVRRGRRAVRAALFRVAVGASSARLPHLCSLPLLRLDPGGELQLHGPAQRSRRGLSFRLELRVRVKREGRHQQGCCQAAAAGFAGDK